MKSKEDQIRDANKKIYEASEQAVNLLVTSCISMAKEWKTTTVSVDYIKNASTVLLSSLKEGLEEKSKPSMLERVKSFNKKK